MSEGEGFTAVGCYVSELLTDEHGKCTVTVKNSEGEAITGVISSRMASELRLSPGYAMDGEEVLTFARYVRIYRAYRAGLSLLSFGDNSKKALVKKLRARGFSPATAEDAVARLEASGLIDEAAHAKRVALAEAGKLYGSRIIVSKLYAKGFEKKHIDEAMRYLCGEVDFYELCREYIHKRRLEDDLRSGERDVMHRASGVVLRRGFSYDDITRFCSEYGEQ